jgi:hypothetical protein
VATGPRAHADDAVVTHAENREPSRDACILDGELSGAWLVIEEHDDRVVVGARAA